MKNILQFIFKRSWVLYAVVLLILAKAIDHQQAGVKTLNFLRDNAFYVNQFSEGVRPYDEKIFFKATTYYQTMTKIMPELPIVYGVLGYCHYYLGNIQNSIQNYKRALEEYPKLFGFHYNLGLIYYEKGMWQKAINYFKEAINVDPQSSVAYYALISKLRLPGTLQGDEWLVKTTETLKNRYDDSLVLMLESYNNLKDYDALYVAAQQVGNTTKSHKDIIQFYAGWAAFQSEKYEVAFFHFNQCIELNSQYKDAYHYAGLALKELEQEKASGHYLKKAQEFVNNEGPVEVILKRQALVFYVPDFELRGEVP